MIAPAAVALRSVLRAGFALAVATGLALPADALHAQGSVSGQGFGYPPGPLGPRALGTGGGPAEHDAGSAVNPAAIALTARTGLFFQYSPEFRRVEVDGVSDRATLVRFPLFGGVARVGERTRAGISIATFLDRTFLIRRETSEIVGGDTVRSADRFGSTGGMSDVRFALSRSRGARLQLGASIHAITGENRLSVVRSFGDTLNLPLEQRVLSYSGGAFSAGAVWTPVTTLSLAGSLRRGTDLRARSGDTLVARARVPDRAGVGLQYSGIRGTTLAVRTEWTGWSAMQRLGTDSLTAFDTWELGGGADVAGPRFGDKVSQLRAGVRWRDLPFGLRRAVVSELTFSGGFGIPLAYDRSMIELAAQRAVRATGDVRERAWTITFGLTVRP